MELTQKSDVLEIVGRLVNELKDQGNRLPLLHLTLGSPHTYMSISVYESFSTPSPSARLPLLSIMGFNGVSLATDLPCFISHWAHCGRSIFQTTTKTCSCSASNAATLLKPCVNVHTWVSNRHSYTESCSETIATFPWCSTLNIPSLDSSHFITSWQPRRRRRHVFRTVQSTGHVICVQRDQGYSMPSSRSHSAGTSLSGTPQSQCLRLQYWE